jgi:hypothetical protein
MRDIQKNVYYSNYESARSLPYNILNKLMTDDEELWKLLKYENPLGKENLTLDEKRAMICKDSINADRYNVVFQKFTDEAMTSDDGKVFAQMRLQVLSGYSPSSATAKVSVIFQFVVSDKNMVCDTDVTPYDNRAFALCQSVINCLNGKPLVEDGNYLYLNDEEDYNGEFKLVTFNKEYSGYVLVMSMNISS